MKLGFSRWVKALGVSAVLATLAGCGFTPLYASPGTAALAAIDVNTPNTRAGFLLRESLEDALAYKPGTRPAYRLDVSVTENRYPRGIRVDDTAFRYEDQMIATYSLIDVATGRRVTGNTTQVQVTYDVADQPYSGVVALQDGQSRAAYQTAQLIRLELSRWFATQSAPNAASLVGAQASQ